MLANLPAELSNLRPPIHFRRLTAADIDELTVWFRDPVLARRVSLPDDTWRTYILSDNGVSKSWAGRDARGRLLCEIQVDRQSPEDPGYINFYIDPALRGQGLAEPILLAFLEEGPGRDYEAMDASIEPDNHASLRCFRACGFVELPEDTEPGMIRLRQGSASSRR